MEKDVTPQEAAVVRVQLKALLRRACELPVAIDPAAELAVLMAETLCRVGPSACWEAA